MPTTEKDAGGIPTAGMLYTPGGALTYPGSGGPGPRRASRKGTWGKRQKAANYAARAGQVIAGRLTRGADGKFSSGGSGDTAKPAAPKKPNRGAQHAAERADRAKRRAADDQAEAETRALEDARIQAAKPGKERARIREQVAAERRARAAKRRQARADEAAGDAKRRADEQAADAKTAADAAAAKPAKEEKPKKGGGGGKGGGGKEPKPSPDEKKAQARQANRESVKGWMRDNDQGLAPAGFDAMLQFADGGKLDPQAEQSLRSMGLVEGDAGAPRLSASAHVAVNAINQGQSRNAVDAIRKAQETKRAADERAAAAAARPRKQKETYGGTPRAKLPDSAFAGPDRSFPIVSARDVRAAVRSLGRTTHDRDAVRQGIIRRARAIGATSALPASWREKAAGRFLIVKDARGQDRWVAISSSAYRDRDGEIVSARALKQAVAIADSGAVPRGPLRFWHVDGLDLGDCDFQAAVGPGGRYLLESGTFRSPAIARALKQAAWPLGISIGFYYPEAQPTDGVFEDIVIYERSILPRSRGANLFTQFAVKEAATPMDDTKLAAARQLLGPELVAQLLGGVQQTDKAAQAAGVAHKEAAAAPAATDWAQRIAALEGELTRLKAAGAPPPADPAAAAAAAAAPAAATDEKAAGDASDLADDGDSAADEATEDGTYVGDLTVQEFEQLLQRNVLAAMGQMQGQIADLDTQLKSMGYERKAAAQKEAAPATAAAAPAPDAQLLARLEELSAKVKELAGEQPRGAFRASLDASTVLAPGSARQKEAEAAQPTHDPLDESFDRLFGKPAAA